MSNPPPPQDPYPSPQGAYPPPHAPFPGQQFPYPPGPVKKSGALKWVLIGCLGALVIGAISVGLMIWYFARSIATEPGEVEARAVALLDFDIPAGVRGAFAMDILGMQMVMLEPSAVEPVSEPRPNRFGLVLMGMPSYAYGGDREAFEKSFKDGLSRGGQDYDVKTRLEPETFTLRGKDVEVQVEIATVSGGATRRQYRMVIDGREKPLFFFVFGEGDGPDHATVQELLDTVR